MIIPQKLRKVVTGPSEPQDIYVPWIDTSIPDKPVLRIYMDGEWREVEGGYTPPPTDNYETTLNKVKQINELSNHIQYPTARAVWVALSQVKPDLTGVERTANKVTSIDQDSTDEQYPSAKAVYTAIDNIEEGLTGVEKTSNKVTSISDASTDTQYPSAAAVYTAIEQSAYSGIPIVTTMPSNGFLPNTLYELGELNGILTFSLGSGTAGILNHYYWTFDTGDTLPEITWPRLEWAWGSAPELSMNKHYEISVVDNYAFFVETEIDSPLTVQSVP